VSPDDRDPSRLVEGGALRPEDLAAAELVSRALPTPNADDLAQERIWRALGKGLATRSTQTRPRWVLALGVAAALVLLAGAAMLTRGTFGGRASARLELTAGAVLAALPERSWARAEPGVTLPEASRLRTDGRSRAVISFSRATALVAPATDLALESVGDSVFLRLSGGEVIAAVEHRKPGSTFVIETTRYRVTVKGTIFAVQESSPDDVRVSVSRGLVEVTGQGGVWSVPAGRSWSSRSPDALSPDDIPSGDRSLLDSVAREGPRSTIRVEGADELDVSEEGVTLGPPPVVWSAPLGSYHFVGQAAEGLAEADATASNGASTTVRLKPVARPFAPPAPGSPVANAAVIQERPAFETPPLPSHRGPQRHRPQLPAHPKQSPASNVPAPLPLRQRASAVAAPAVRPDRLDDRMAESSSGAVSGGAAPAQETPPIPEPARPFPARLERPVSAAPMAPTGAALPQAAAPDAYSTAVALAHGKRYEDAARAFEVVANGHGPRADLALYELGRILQLHLGRPEGALESYLRYEREYPRGSLSQEVEISAIELELQRRDLNAALGQMGGFLERHPNSERAPEVHLLRGDVLRERGDCKAALAEYQRADAPRADDALFFTAWCQQKLGRRDDAGKSFTEYLKQFSSGRHAAEARAALGME
jgi:TolA-binding protein